MRRVVDDESGMTMGLVVIMIVLLGVMSAGLLTFVSTDLNTVVEENRGQRAFELADAGIGAAKRQLSSDAVIDHYNGGTGDVQWSAGKTNGGSNCPSGTTHGMCLFDLDGTSGTTDRVNVTIEHRSLTEDFRVVSTGEYGVARRKVEAIFRSSAGFPGGPAAFYTQSSIKIECCGVSMSGQSFFSKSNITIENLPDNSAAGFKADYEDPNGGALKINGGEDDERGDWDTRLYSGSPTWNTVGRKGYPGYPAPFDNSSRVFDKLGFAAERMICGSSSCAQPSNSVADGVYGYDSTTGPTDPRNRGNKLKFVNKTPQDKDPNDAGTITYPFARAVPDAAQLKSLAQSSNTYYKGSSPDWNALFPNAASTPRVIFIDAQGSEVNFKKDTNQSNNKGILVVWCGKLTQESTFTGIIITLFGPATEPGGTDNTDCGAEKGGYVLNSSTTLTGYVYAEGNVGSATGIEIKENSTIRSLTGPGRDSLLDYAFGDSTGGGGSGSVTLQGWRELYQ